MVLLTKTRTSLLRLACVAVATLSLAACSTVAVSPRPSLDSGAKWGMVPFTNHTETPQAGLRAESITEGLLRSTQAMNLQRYPASLNTETLFEPMDRKQQAAARTWAKEQGIRYAVSGSVDEWRYKVGVDGEPAVGLTLQVIDIDSGEVVWSAVGSSTGWSREALTAVAQKLTRKLIEPLAMSRP